MKAAIVHAAGQPPRFGDFAEPQPGAGERRIIVHAAALSQLTRARASGTHYSSSGGFPFVAGVDGTGALDDGRDNGRNDGRMVYFMLPRAPFGAMAEVSVAPAAHCLALPAALDPVVAATIANPGMSSWAALTERARFRPGETVLINGATGASGLLAVQIARHLGASRVIATGRNRDILAGLGADATIALTDDGPALEVAFAEQFAQGVDVVLDYIYGPSAVRLLSAAAGAGAPAVPIRFVQIGTAAGAEIALPGAMLRSSALELMGSGLGSVPMERLLAAIAGVFAAAAAGKLSLPATTTPLADVTRTWAATSDTRVVFTPRE